MKTTELGHRMELFVPKGLTDILSRWERDLADVYGGVSRVSANGAWLDHTSKVVVEPVAILVVQSDGLPRLLADMEQWAQEMLNAGEQAALATVDGRGYLYERD